MKVGDRVVIADPTDFKCPFCVAGQCSGGVDQKAGLVVAHSLPACVVFEQLPAAEFLVMVNRLHCMARRRRVAQA